MPFIPHTEEDIAEMLASIGAKNIEELFDEIPSELVSGQLTGVPPGLSEMEITRLMMERAGKD
ncbi:MAG TPA: glycine dehydrogenase, partial [Nitrosomonas sp.]|nr:glycine dehydrogenase [Nitrosomonas sp.]